MEKKALIKVLSSQIGNEEDSIEIVTQGSFYKKENYYYAVYEETELSGMDGTTTTMKFNGEEFNLIRMGTTNTEMKFKNEDENISMYSTPYGTLELLISTNELDIQVDDEGGDVFIDYYLSVEGQQTNNTQLKVNIKSQN
ncbi:YwiB family protein [Clostridium sp. DL1XJH146]